MRRITKFLAIAAILIPSIALGMTLNDGIQQPYLNISAPNQIDGVTVNPNTAAAGTFTAVTATNTSNQVILGTTRTLTLTAPTPASSSRTLTLPDPGGSDSV